MAYNRVGDVQRNYLNSLKAQLVLGLCAFLIISVVYRDVSASLAAGLGLMMALLPAIMYVVVVWKSHALPVHKLYKQHKKAMLVKFLTNLLLFVAVLVTYHGAYLLTLFMTYIITLAGSWLSLVTNRG